MDRLAVLGHRDVVRVDDNTRWQAQDERLVRERRVAPGRQLESICRGTDRGERGGHEGSREEE
jgi:hypothetical protein